MDTVVNDEMAKKWGPLIAAEMTSNNELLAKVAENKLRWKNRERALIFTPEERVKLVSMVDRLVASGMTREQAFKSLSLNDVSYYMWKKRLDKKAGQAFGATGDGKRTRLSLSDRFKIYAKAETMIRSGFTQKDAAEQLGFSSTYIGTLRRIFKAKRFAPKSHNVPKAKAAMVKEKVYGPPTEVPKVGTLRSLQGQIDILGQKINALTIVLFGDGDGNGR